MKKLVTLAAALTLGLTVPAQAHNADYGPIGFDNNGRVNVAEAADVTFWTAFRYGYHGGVSSWTLRRYAPLDSDYGRWVELNVRFRDGSFGTSLVTAPCDDTGCRYHVSFRHQG